MTAPVTIVIQPGADQARDLPDQMVADVATVLAVYGLRLADATAQHRRCGRT